MQNSVIVAELMFDYAQMSVAEIGQQAQLLPAKLARWVAMNHPDNRTRKHIFRATGVPIGKDAVLNIHLSIADNYESLVRIGERASIAQNVTIVADSNANNSVLLQTPQTQPLMKKAPVLVGADSWIGAGVIVLPGVIIGERSIIGAGSVLTRSVPSDVIYAGVPAQLIRRISTTTETRQD